MEYQNLLKLAHMNLSVKKNESIGDGEKMPSKRDEFLSVLKRERTRKHPQDINNKSFIIGNNYGISALENFDKYNNDDTLPKYGKRGKIFLEFMKLVNTFDISKYVNDEQADQFSENLELISNESGNVRQDKRTSLSSLVARIIFLVHRQHRKDQIISRKKKHQDYVQGKKNSNIKRTAKYNTIKNQMGVDAFNKMKKRDQHAKDVKNASKMDDNLDETTKFLEWRKTNGKYLDVSPQAVFVQPLFWKDGFTVTKELGYASLSTLCQLAKNIVQTSTWKGDNKYSNPQISFKVDPADPKSQLYQYAAMNTIAHGNFMAQLSHTNDVKNKVFNITGYHEYGDSFYINVDNLTNHVNLSLPKRWSKFELWQGFGVMGNPGHTCIVKLLLKICPYNIDTFSFIKDGARYVVRHTLIASMQMSNEQLLNSIPDKLEQAVKQATEAREKQKRSQAISNKLLQQASNHEQTKLKLTQLLANGLIDEKTFKMGMSALE